jgi:hypothetical protein
MIHGQTDCFGVATCSADGAETTIGEVVEGGTGAAAGVDVLGRLSAFETLFVRTAWAESQAAAAASLIQDIVSLLDQATNPAPY